MYETRNTTATIPLNPLLKALALGCAIWRQKGSPHPTWQSSKLEAEHYYAWFVEKEGADKQPETQEG